MSTISDDENVGFSSIFLQARRRKSKLLSDLLEMDDDPNFSGEVDAEQIRNAFKPFKHRNTGTRMDYKASVWWQMLERSNCANFDHRDGKYFRRRFRVPFPVFKAMLNLCRENKWYPECHRSVPLEVCP